MRPYITARLNAKGTKLHLIGVNISFELHQSVALGIDFGFGMLELGLRKKA